MWKRDEFLVKLIENVEDGSRFELIIIRILLNKCMFMWITILFLILNTLKNNRCFTEPQKCFARCTKSEKEVFRCTKPLKILLLDTREEPSHMKLFSALRNLKKVSHVKVLPVYPAGKPLKTLYIWKLFFKILYITQNIFREFVKTPILFLVEKSLGKKIVCLSVRT